MKLVQLLAKELKEWPEGVTHLTQSEVDYEIYDGLDGNKEDSVEPLDEQFYASRSHSEGSYPMVTRDQWQAEREKMDKPKWIRHRGGKCPVADDVKVLYRMRSGTITSRGEPSRILSWDHSKSGGDIMAYRVIEETKDQEIEEVRKFSNDVDMNIGQGEIIHGPVSIGDTVITAAHPKFDTNLGTLTYKLEVDTTSAMTALNELSAKWDQLESPLKWRDEIIELEAYEEEFRREREKLIRKLESEGFKMIDHMAPVYGEQVIDLSDWRNWQAGDIVECLTDTYSGVYTKGQQYEVKSVNRDDFNVFDNYGEPSSCGWDDDDCDGLKFVRRP